jgi:hypothetical protein
MHPERPSSAAIASGIAHSHRRRCQAGMMPPARYHSAHGTLHNGTTMALRRQDALATGLTA